MARSRRVLTAIWNEDFALAKARLVYLALMTRPEINSFGCLRVPLPALALEMGIESTELEQLFSVLEAMKLLYWDRDLGFFWLPDFLRHNPPESLNVVRGFRRCYQQMPPAPLREAAIFNARKYLSEKQATVLDEVFADLRPRFKKPPHVFWLWLNFNESGQVNVPVSETKGGNEDESVINHAAGYAAVFTAQEFTISAADGHKAVAQAFAHAEGTQQGHFAWLAHAAYALPPCASDPACKLQYGAEAKQGKVKTAAACHCLDAAAAYPDQGIGRREKVAKTNGETSGAASLNEGLAQELNKGLGQGFESLININNINRERDGLTPAGELSGRLLASMRYKSAQAGMDSAPAWDGKAGRSDTRIAAFLRSRKKADGWLAPKMPPEPQAIPEKSAQLHTAISFACADGETCLPASQYEEFRRLYPECDAVLRQAALWLATHEKRPLKAALPAYLAACLVNSRKKPKTAKSRKYSGNAVTIAASIRAKMRGENHARAV